MTLVSFTQPLIYEITSDLNTLLIIGRVFYHDVLCAVLRTPDKVTLGYYLYSWTRTPRTNRLHLFGFLVSVLQPCVHCVSPPAGFPWIITFSIARREITDQHGLLKDKIPRFPLVALLRYCKSSLEEMFWQRAQKCVLAITSISIEACCSYTLFSKSVKNLGKSSRKPSFISVIYRCFTGSQCSLFNN